MRLIHLELELEFAEEFKSISISQQLHKALTGNTSTIKETEEPGVIFRSPKKKLMVEWDTFSCNIVLESITSYDDCLDKMGALLGIVDKVAPLDLLSSKKFSTYWILPMENSDFKTIEQKYRSIFITQQSIWENNYDSSVIIDMKRGNLILHHQSGAMEKKQLINDFTIFKLDDIPKVCLFLWAVTESKKTVKYSKNDINSFLTTSFQHCKNHSEVFEEVWREKYDH